MKPHVIPVKPTSQPANRSTGSETDPTSKESQQYATPALQMKGYPRAMPPMQVQSPVIQLKEVDGKTPEKQLGMGDWRPMDRVKENTIWQRACLYNLVNGNSQAYTQPQERRDFYLWLYNYTSGLGYETRWPIAAYMVASGATQLSYGSIFSNDVQVAARQGNQIIFDDVFPKLKKLVTGGVLKGKKAMDWDMEILSEEQELVQHMYKGLKKSTVKEFEGYAKGTHASAQAGSLAGFTYPQRSGKYHRNLPMPFFTGDIMDIDDRFQYGMMLANYYSTHPKHKGKPTRPAAGKDYTSGKAFKGINNRMGLHRLDAELDDFDVDEAKVIKLMQALTTDEQKLLGDNLQRLRFLADSLSKSEMTKALSGLAHVKAEVKKWLFDNL